MMDGCVVTEGLNVEGKATGEFQDLEAGWQKPVFKAEIDLKAKAAAERALLLWYKVLREMAELFHLQNNNTLLPLCLTMMRSVEQTLQMNDVMVATWGHKLRVILGEGL